jgi:hypothetical protein
MGTNVLALSARRFPINWNILLLAEGNQLLYSRRSAVIGGNQEWALP